MASLDVRLLRDCVAKLDRPVRKGSVGFNRRFMLPFEGATASLAASDATLTPSKQRAAVAVDGRAAWQAASGSARLLCAIASGRSPTPKPSDSHGNIDQGHIVYYRANKHDCSTCLLKPQCTTAPMRKVTRDVDEDVLMRLRLAFTSAPTQT